MLAQHRRQWANISPALGQRLLWAASTCTAARQTDRHTLAQHRVNVWCLMGRPRFACTIETAGRIERTDRKDRLTEQTKVNQHVPPPCSVQWGRHNKAERAD